MKFLDFLVNYGGFIITCITTIIAFILYLLNHKGKLNQKGLVDILRMIPDLVQRAENQFGAKKGACKLDWVLDKVKLYALSEHIAINDKDITEFINNVVGTTKQVNTFELKPSRDAGVGTNNDVNENTENNI